MEATVALHACCQVGVGSVDEAMDVLRRGSRIRQKAATALNYGSSRSHSIFAIALYGAAAEASLTDAAEGALGRCCQRRRCPHALALALPACS